MNKIKDENINTRNLSFTEPEEKEIDGVMYGGYKIGDEFEVTDEHFDVNDIVSFALWAYCEESDERIFVLEDETA